MKRQLFALRISIQLPGHPYPWETIVGVDQEPEIRLANGSKFCDIVAGSMVDAGPSGLRKVVSVQIADAIPCDQIGRIAPKAAPRSKANSYRKLFERTPRVTHHTHQGLVELGAYALNRLRRAPTVGFHPWNADLSTQRR